MIPIEQARARVLEGCPVLPAEAVAISEALDLVVAAPVVARQDVPPFANTAVDGYAVRAADTRNAPVELTVVGYLPAGAAPTTPVGPGEAIRIMTGAPVPEGADAMVMVEDTDLVTGAGAERVRVGRVVQAGDALRHAGDDVRAGAVVLEAGTVLRAPHLGVLASLGETTVMVHRRPRVAVLSTGDELVADGGELRPGQIRESNKSMLLALVAQAGCTPVDLGLVRDDPDILIELLLHAAQNNDAIVSSGGVSMGDADVVKLVLDRVGTMQWMQVAIKPAKPFAFGIMAGPDRAVPVFGLPGNPVSSFVSFELLARPGLRTMMGHTEVHRPEVLAVAVDGLTRRPDGKVHFVRVHGRFGTDGRLVVRSTGAQGSHQLAATAGANGLARLDDGDGVAPGGDVPVLWLG